MRLTLRLLGTEVFHISTDREPEPEDDKARDLSGGTTAATPMGFSPSYGDQRWEKGQEP